MERMLRPFTWGLEFVELLLYDLIIIYSRHRWKNFTKIEAVNPRIVIPACSTGYGTGPWILNERKCLS